MNPNADLMQSPEIMEALRRRAALGGSSAGIGAEQAGAPMGAIAQMGQSAMQGGAMGSPMGEAMTALPKQEPSEATLILKALTSRLKQLPPTGGL